jgi:hypothetical protein
MFELQTLEVPELAELGARVELRELFYGDEQRALMAGGPRGLEWLLCATLHVDGAPYTIGQLDALPGRFGGPITRAMKVVMKLYRLEDPVEGSAETPAPPAPVDDDAGVARGNA